MAVHRGGEKNRHGRGGYYRRKEVITDAGSGLADDVRRGRGDYNKVRALGEVYVAYPPFPGKLEKSGRDLVFRERRKAQGAYKLEGRFRHDGKNRCLGLHQEPRKF